MDSNSIVKKLKSLYREQAYAEIKEYVIVITNDKFCSLELRKIAEDYLGKAELGEIEKEILTKIDAIEAFISQEKIADAKGLLAELENQISKSDAKIQKKFSDKIENNKNSIEDICLKSSYERIKVTADKGDITTCISEYGELLKIYTPRNLIEINNYIKNIVEKTLDDYLKNKEINVACNLILTLKRIDSYRNQSFVEDYEKKIYENIQTDIKNKLELYEIDEASSFLESYKYFLPNSIIIDIQKRIETNRSSTEVKIKNYEKAALSFANKENFEKAEEYLKQAEKLKGYPIESLRQEISNLAAAKIKRENKTQCETLISHINGYLQKLDVHTAIQKLAELEKNPEANKRQVEELKIEIKELKNNIENEGKFNRKQPILLMPSFNVPKKIDKGEDADPLFEVSSHRNWGVLGVFDGMGGAGARRYTHKDTHEEHTSAYWASRFVRIAVLDLINKRPIGTEPLSYIEMGLHKAIMDKLDSEIINFPEAAIPAPSKAIRKLPTTMALCVYYTYESKVDIHCYWAGDSRIYLLDKNQQYYLTIDDANALDPFSPANSDLAMNNTICQDKDKPFRINKSCITLEFSDTNPLVLIAATDGCFGYYKNPIEFEQMLRFKLSKSENIEKWSIGIKQAIIDNIQQDDFSMALVSLGTDSFSTLKSSLTVSLNKEIFQQYGKWREELTATLNQKQDTLNVLSKQLEDIRKEENIFEEQIVKCEKYREKIDELKPLIEEGEQIIGDSLLNPSHSERLLQIISQLKNKKEAAIAKQKKVQDELASQKVELEKFQLLAENDNNKWYEEYKKSVTVVEYFNII